MAATLQFVDEISVSPNVRLDLNEGAWALADADFSPPPMKRSFTSTFLEDGGPPNAEAFDNRVVRLRLELTTASESAMATQLALLNKELNRARNILKWQPGTTPAFYRTFRSPDYNLGITVTEGVAAIDVPLLAEPFGYGVRVDVAVGAVTNNPAAATRPLYFDIDNVAGEVETPAFMRMTMTETAPVSLVVARYMNREYGILGPFGAAVHQAEAMTMGTDTTVSGSSDAAMSGTGNNYARTTFASAAGMTKRIHSGNVLDPHRGSYRVFVRHRRSVAGDSIAGRVRVMRTTTGGSAFHLPTVTHPAGITGPYWVDYGLVQVPSVPEPGVIGYDGKALTTTPGYFDLEMQRVAGSGTVDTDYLLLLPATHEFAAVDLSTIDANITASSGRALVLDGPNNAAYIGSEPVGNSPPTKVADAGPVRPPAGGLPNLTPGRTNRLYIINTSPGIALNSTVDVVLSYWPRHIYVPA